MAFIPSKKKRHRRNQPKAYLMLTPMVDVFVCLLLFLLQSFSASNEAVVSDKNFQLPISNSRTEPHAAVTIKVNSEMIVLDNAAVIETPVALKSEELLIAPLYQGLLKKAEQSKYISQQNRSVQFRGEVVIQGDRIIPFQLLKKIMYTCSRAEYGNIALAVLQRE